MKNAFIVFLLIVFLSGVYAIISFNQNSNTEDFNSQEQPSKCPNLLIQKGNSLLLYNTTQPIVDNVNPIPFFNLDEYINYLEMQRKKGINCPVLFLQQESNAQGEDVYRMRPSPFDLQGGLSQMNTVTQSTISPVIQVADADRENMPYNKNNYAGFDPHNQYEGEYTNLDVIHDSTQDHKISDNPMDPNWAGVQYTQQMIDSGKYAENNITQTLLFQPKTVFYPMINGPYPQPVDVI
jgi:hypothetical protein